MSKLAEVLIRYQSPEDELYVLACDAMRGTDIPTAARWLRAWATNRPDLLEAALRHYLNTVVVPDMTGAALKSTQGARAVLPTGRGNDAPSRGPHESGEASLRAPSGQKLVASPLSPHEDGKAHVGPAQARVLSPSPSSTIPDRGGQRRLASGSNDIAPPVRKPNPSRGINAIASVQRAVDKRLFDTFKVRGGIAIGDLTVYEARTIAETNEREARVLRHVCDHIAGYVPPGTPLRDAIKPATLAKAIAASAKTMSA